MSRVVFWDYGQGGASEMAAAGACCMAQMRSGRVLLVNEEGRGRGVEAGFRSGRDHVLTAFPHLAESGLDALLRLADNQRLSSTNFMDYTYPVMIGKLDLICGRNTTTGNVTDSEYLSLLYSVADDVYDWIFSSYEFTKIEEHPRAVKGDDRAVIHIPVMGQNRLELERFFEEGAADHGRSECADMLVLHNYDIHSHWTANNIRRRYNCKIPIVAIPYSTEFRDAWNNSALLRYTRLNRMFSAEGSKKGTLQGMMKLCTELQRLAGSYASNSFDKGVSQIG